MTKLGDGRILRRRLLQLVGAGWSVILTGCVELVPFDTNESVEITSFELDIPAEPGTLTYELTVEADEELNEIRIETGKDSITTEPNDTVYEDSGSITAKGGKINDVTVTAVTVEGSEDTVTNNQYTREFKPYDGTVEFEFSPHYLLFWDGGETKSFDRAGVGTPETGPYSQTVNDFNRSNREVFERHFDVMRGHGINRVQFNLGESDEERDRIRMYHDNITLLDEMKIEFSYPIIQAFRRERDIFGDFDVMVEILEAHEKRGTIDGRPTVYLWGFLGLYHNDDIYARITNEHGGLEELVHEIRDALTIGDSEPFLIPDIWGFGEVWGRTKNEPEDLYPAITACDGVSHWSSGLLNEQGEATQEEWLESMYDRISGTRSFADEHDLEYVPFILPGFDDRDNEIWGEDRYAKPAPDILDQMAAWATEYATTDLCFVATWNDWAEGHMIEPGTYDGEDFGTAYLEVLETHISE